MAEGGGDFEIFNAPAAREGQEMSDEQIAEEMRKTQQALAQLAKEEGQARAHDQKLAQIIIQFLMQPGNTDLFLLISRAVAQDIPSELILALIALVDEKAMAEVAGLLKAAPAARASHQPLALRQPGDFKALPPEHRVRIDRWIENIYEVASKAPQRVLESVVRKSKISPAITQLGAFILRKYLDRFGIVSEFRHLHEFMEAVFLEMVRRLSELVAGQKQLRQERASS